jgi:signal transduction histidine kinase
VSLCPPYSRVSATELAPVHDCLEGHFWSTAARALSPFEEQLRVIAGDVLVPRNIKTLCRGIDPLSRTFDLAYVADGSLIDHYVPEIDDESREDLQRGLAVISSRAEALTRFMQAYSKLARLPQPKFQDVDLAAAVRRVVDLERRVPVRLHAGPEVSIQADPDQIEQLLINLLRNAVDAALETGGGVCLAWHRQDSHVEVLVQDEGPGLSSTANLFVPFFTTKPGGSGIGLVLSRQIAEAHGGTLTLENRPDARGCEARLLLPV